MPKKYDWPTVRKNIRDRIIAETKNTVGWLEAENKESFKVGMTIALDKALEELDTMKHYRDMAQEEADRHRGNMMNIVETLDQYRSED